MVCDLTIEGTASSRLLIKLESTFRLNYHLSAVKQHRHVTLDRESSIAMQAAKAAVHLIL
jgi:hypothetical protein